MVDRLSGGKMNEKRRAEASTNIVMLLYVVVIALVVLPIVAGFVSTKILTIIKIAIVAYCLFLCYQIWNAFGGPASPTSKS